jgi:hypothetical protein
VYLEGPTKDSKAYLCKGWANAYLCQKASQ